MADLNDKICELRDKLNKSIEDKEPYDVTLKISEELDKLIAQFYKEKEETKENREER